MITVETGQRRTLTELMQAVEDELRRLHYSEHTIRHRKDVWRRYLRFTNCEHLDEADWSAFLLQCYGISKTREKLTHYQQSVIMAKQLLFQCEQEGFIHSWDNVKRDPVPYPEEFNKTVEHFLQHLQKEGRVETTINDYARMLRRFTKFLKQGGIYSFADLTPEYITPFIATVTTYHGKSIGCLLGELRQFFRFLYLNEYHAKDLSLFIPKHNCLSAREHLPSIWSQEDIEKILAAVDVRNPTGKRDYAIILLVSRLGLRVSDITHLKFEHLKWDKNCIEIMQYKTKMPLSLPLFEDVGMAIIDYLRNGRPQTESQHIFVRHTAPFVEFDKNNRLHHTLNGYILRAGLEITPEKSHGMHTLRHSLATELVKREIPLPVISEILGHQNTKTTANYLRMDVEQLRSCALGV